MRAAYLRSILLLSLVLILFTSLNAQSKESFDQSKKQSVDKVLKIKSRDAPDERVLNECYLPKNTSQIFVALLVTFHSSGKITDAKIMGGYSSCKKFDEECLKAARKIRFTPEIKNGIPVTVVKAITYQFVASRSL